jgi:hypothetical protein
MTTSPHTCYVRIRPTQSPAWPSHITTSLQVLEAFGPGALLGGAIQGTGRASHL